MRKFFHDGLVAASLIFLAPALMLVWLAEKIYPEGGTSIEEISFELENMRDVHEKKVQDESEER